MEGREAGEPACSRTEGAQGTPGEGLQPCIPPTSFFSYITSPKSFCCFFWGTSSSLQLCCRVRSVADGVHRLKKTVLPSCWV